MPILNIDIVVPSSNIEFGEMFHILEFVNKVRNERERIGILDGVLIQIAIILVGVEFPVLLLTKKKGKAWGN